MNDFEKSMRDVYLKSKVSIEKSYNALSMIDNDFEGFLINFFDGDVNKNLFLTNIFYNGEESVRLFQDYLFRKSCVYFDSVIRMDDVKYHFNSNIPFSNIDLSISDSNIISINIFSKSIIVYEKSFFEVIDKGIEDKQKEIDKITRKYDAKINSLDKNNTLNFEKDKSLFTNVANSTVFRKKSKKEKVEEVQMLGYELLGLENELNELLITRDMMLKNLSNIKYFQERIVNRIKSKTKYQVIVS